MKKDYLPIAIGFWGIAVPLLISVFLCCKTPAQKLAIFFSSVIFFLLGFFTFKAKL